jgi:hypothetical protein
MEKWVFPFEISGPQEFLMRSRLNRFAETFSLMVASAQEKKADRFKGGVSYHLLEPTREERAWQEQHREEIEAIRKKKE